MIMKPSARILNEKKRCADMTEPEEEKPVESTERIALPGRSALAGLLIMLAITVAILVIIRYTLL